MAREGIRIAAIRYAGGEGEAADELLRGLAETLRAKGYKLAGTIQWNVGADEGVRCEMAIEDLSSGERVSASLDPACRGQGCRLDAAALEDVAGLAATGVSPDVDFVIINRFGKQEAAGRGFRAMIEASVASGIPIVTCVSGALMESWQDFTGGAADELPLEAEALARWSMAALASEASVS